MENMKKMEDENYKDIGDLIVDLESAVYDVLELQQEVNTYKENINRSLNKIMSHLHAIRFRTNFDNDDGHLSFCEWHCSMEAYNGSNTVHGDIYQLNNGLFIVHTPSAYPELRKWEVQTSDEIINNYRGILSEYDKAHLMNAGEI